MRTTLKLDPDLVAAAKKIAAAQDRSVGAVISDLAKRGLQTRSGRESDTRNGFPVFRARKSAPPISPDDVKRDEDGG